MSARNTLAAKAVRRELRDRRHERGTEQQLRSVAAPCVRGLFFTWLAVWGTK